ncbi:unnamed protein product [Parnassius apollo]|uniref:(apollo) hypothetical protein n=1 Tax=Parnassius apollo TaxID=110799 RepID=A0A8S3XNQ5_PARAO|nr:unnamed protein product [Parnassius apollo]
MIDFCVENAFTPVVLSENKFVGATWLIQFKEIQSGGRGACDALPRDACAGGAAPARAALRGVCVVCRPPLSTPHLPCAACPPPYPLNYEHLHAQVSSPPNSVSKRSRCVPTINQLGSEDKSVLSKKIDKVTVPKKQFKENGPNKLSHLCFPPPKIVAEPPRCRQPSLFERLRSRPKSSCRRVRKLHSAVTNLTKCDNNKIDKHIISKTELQSVISEVLADAAKLNKILSDRNELKEAASGRIILEEQKREPIESGGIKLPVPAGVHTVKVQVTLH